MLQYLFTTREERDEASRFAYDRGWEPEEVGIAGLYVTRSDEACIVPRYWGDAARRAADLRRQSQTDIYGASPDGE